MGRYKKGTARDIFDAVLFVIFLILLFSAFDAEAQEPIPHPWDYVSHMVGGAVVVEFTEADTPLEAALYTGVVGIVKEMTDEHFDNADAIAWVVGGILYQQYKVRIKAVDDVMTANWSIGF